MDDDVARLFRENYNLGPDSHVLLRPMQQLLKSGKTLGPMSALWFKLPNGDAYPFAVLTWTKNRRFVFWPILPKTESMAGVLDHITLEFPSFRSHRTAYEAVGKPRRVGATDLGHERAWRLKTLPGTGVGLWLSLAVKTSTLVNQDQNVQRRVASPSSAEKERRTAEFVRHLQELNNVEIPLPPDQNTTPSYICCNIYVVLDASQPISPPSDTFLVSGVAAHVKGWQDGVPFQILSIKLPRGGHDLIIETACPPGELMADVWIGLARPR